MRRWRPSVGVSGVSIRFEAFPLMNTIYHRSRGHCILDDIFRLVADGQVALLRAPHGRGASLDWVHWQLSLLASTPSDLLEECLRAFSTQYANTPDNDLLAALHTEIAEDFLCLQSSPSIIENYRQYVVIKATSTGDCSGKHGGLVRFTVLPSERRLADSSLPRWNGPHLMTSIHKMASSKLLTAWSQFEYVATSIYAFEI